MKCSQCGKELSAEESKNPNSLCAECAKTSIEGQSKQSGKKTFLMVGILLVLLMIGAGIFFASRGNEDQDIDHMNPIAASFSTEEAGYLVKDGKILPLYCNKAENEMERKQIQQMFSSPLFVSRQNYAELANGETVYISLTFNSMQDVHSKMISLDAKGQETVIAEEVRLFAAYSDDAVYYETLTKDGKVQQFQYKDGASTPVSQLAGRDDVILLDVSKDGRLSYFANEKLESGYLYNGELHMMEAGYNILDISKTGTEVYVRGESQVPGLIDLYRVKDLTTGELEPLGKQVSEVMQYDNGNVSFLGDCALTEGTKNPIGTIYIFNAETGKIVKAAEGAAAIVESSLRPEGWMNENGRDLLPIEMTQEFTRDHTIYEGNIHYINEDGSFCAASFTEEGQEDAKVIAEDFYDINNFTYHPEVSFITAADKYLYWARGSELFRYELGSLADPKIIPLDESIEDKLKEESAQLGYIVSGSGDIVEETRETLVLKKFDSEESITVLENVGELRLLGMDNAGKHMYFLSEDGSMYEKSIETRSNPKLISPKVFRAATAEDGLYFMALHKNEGYDPTIGESEALEAGKPTKEYQYNLMYLEYGKTKPEMIYEDVIYLAGSHIG